LNQIKLNTACSRLNPAACLCLSDSKLGETWLFGSAEHGKLESNRPHDLIELMNRPKLLEIK